MDRINSDAIHHGRNPDLGTWKDNRNVRCGRCGFICNLDRDSREPRGSRVGNGITLTSQTTLVAQTGIATTNAPQWVDHNGTSTNIYDPIVSRGCPQCGTLLYNKEA